MAIEENAGHGFAGGALLWALIAAVFLCAAAGLVQAQEMPPPPEGAAQAAAAVEPSPDTSLHINPLWLLLVAAAVSIWLYLTAWASDDARAVKLDFQMVASLMLAAGGIGLAFTLLVHAAFAFVLLLLTLAAFGVYVAQRNKVVPEMYRLLGPYHRAKILSKMPGLSGLVTAAARPKARPSALPLISEAGQSLQSLTEALPGLAEGVQILKDLIGLACTTYSRKVRFYPAEGQYVAQYILDDVPHNVQVFDAKLAQQILACASLLMGLTRGGRMHEGSGRFTVQTFGHTAVLVEGQISSVDGRPTFLLAFSDWHADAYMGGLEALGMHSAVVGRLRAALDQPRGAILVCGPKGCGRTTTLYGLVGAIDIFTTNVALVERRPEHELDHVRRWNLDVDGSFRDIYQEILREAPDTLMFGEIQNAEEARRLMEFAVEDGLVLGELDSLGVTDAPLRLARLVGDAELVSRSLTCLISPILVRKLCTNCRELVEPNPELLKKVGINPQDPGTWYRPVGCEACLSCGYSGRIGVFSMLIMTEPVIEVVRQTGATARQIQKAAGKLALRTLYQDGLSKVAAGLTTLDELRRVLKRVEPGSAAPGEVQ